MRVLVASKYGFCMGVKRAVEMASKIADSGGGATVLHQIVHNPTVSKELLNKGVGETERIEEVKTQTVIFSAHGVSPQTRLTAENLNLKIIDATCPLVLKVHGIVKSYAMRGYKFIYIGHKGHPEPLGVIGEAPGKVCLIEKIEDIQELRMKNEERLIVVTQTTLSVEDTDKIIEALKKKYPKAKIFNTVCKETTDRQRALREILDRVEVVVVVGGKNSSNSQRLVDLAIKAGKIGYLVESDKDLEKEWFKGVKAVGLTAGASTPDSETVKVKKYLESI